MMPDPDDASASEVEELLAAIAEARDRAREAYAFSTGCSYAYAAMVAANKAALLAGAPERRAHDARRHLRRR